MKRNFTKILSLLLMLTVLCSVIFALNISANAASSTIYVNKIAMSDGQYLKENATAVTTTKPSSDYAYYKNGVLYLYSFDLKWNGGSSRTGAINAGNGDLIIELHGTSTITSSVSQTIVGAGTTKLTFRGGGKLSINSSADNAIYCGNLEVADGTLSVNAAGIVIDTVSYTQSGGKVNLTTSGKEGIIATGQVLLANGSLKITGADIGIQTSNRKNVEIGRCDVTMENVKTGIHCDGTVTLNGNSITKITASQNGIICKDFNITKTEEFLVSGQSGLAVSSSNKSWTVDSKYATSVSTNYQGKDAVPLSNQSAATAKYFYTRVEDVYIAGIPIGIGEYLPKNGKAASTYKLSDNCVSVQLNGERTELTFCNFDIAATGSTEGIKAATMLEITGTGTLNITSQAGPAIQINTGYLTISHSGTVNIKSDTKNGILLQNSGYIQYSGTVNVYGNHGIAATGDVINRKGRLNVYAAGIGIGCENITVNGGCLDAIGKNRALLIYGKLSAADGLLIRAAATPTSPLKVFDTEGFSAHGRVFVGDHICYGAVATCQTPMKCSDCGKTFDIYGDHNWSTVWDANTKEGHAHKCKTKGCTATTEPVTHTPGAAATETKDQTCTTCGYIITPKLSHTHSLKKFSAVKATCEKSGNMEYYSCSGCSKIFQDAAATKEYTDVNSIITPPTGHTFAETWSMDASGHWHACTACGASEGKVNHTPGPEATLTTDQTCSVCGFVIKKAESHTHDFGEHWFSDDSAHWHACACGEVSEKAAHADTDGDHACDSCYWEMEVGEESTDPAEPTQPVTEPDATEGDNKKPDQEQIEKPEGDDDQGGISPIIIAVCIIGVIVLAAGTALVIILVKHKKQ